MVGDFSDINQQLLEQAIEVFWDLDFREISEIEIGKALYNILFQNQFSERRFFEMYIIFNNPDKDKLFRVRRNISSLSEVISDENNFWCLPKDKIKQGRLNNNCEQILYASFDKLTAFLETGIKKNEKFLLIEYKIKNNIELKCIQMDGRFGKNSAISKIYNDFFNEIMMKSEEEKPGIYKVSNYIKDVFFKLNDFDGWYYVSARNKKLENVALIYPKIKEHIKIRSLKIAELNDDSSFWVHEKFFFN